jgi:hypothetical protein
MLLMKPNQPVIIWNQKVFEFRHRFHSLATITYPEVFPHPPQMRWNLDLLLVDVSL